MRCEFKCAPHEPGGLVQRIVGAMAEIKASLIELLFGPQDEIA